MKKFTKVTLIIAAVLGGIGIAFSIASIGLGVNFSEIRNTYSNWDWEGKSFIGRMWGGENMEESFEQVKSLSVELGVTDMVIVEDDIDDFQVRAENVAKRFSCKLDKDGTLKIKDNDRFSNNSLNRRGSKVTLTVPRGTEFQEMDLEVGVGQLQSFEVDTRELDLQCGVGSVQFEGKLAGKSEVECGIGKVMMELENKAEEFDYEIECGIGSVEIGGKHYSGLSNKAKIENGSGNKMDIKCGLGNVSVSFKE